MTNSKQLQNYVQGEWPRHKSKDYYLLMCRRGQCGTTPTDKWKPQKSSRICQGCVSRVISLGTYPIASRFGFCSHLTPDHRTLPIQLCVHRSGITRHVILYFDSSERVLHQPHNPVNLPSHDHRRLVTARVSSAPICSHIVRIGVWSVRSES